MGGVVGRGNIVFGEYGIPQGHIPRRYLFCFKAPKLDSLLTGVTQHYLTKHMFPVVHSNTFSLTITPPLSPISISIVVSYCSHPLNLPVFFSLISSVCRSTRQVLFLALLLSIDYLISSLYPSRPPPQHGLLQTSHTCLTGDHIFSLYFSIFFHFSLLFLSLSLSVLTSCNYFYGYLCFYCSDPLHLSVFFYIPSVCLPTRHVLSLASST